MEVRLAVEEVEEPLVVEELGIPLLGLVVAEVIAQRHQEHVAPEEPGLLPVLVQEQACPVGGEGNQLMRSLTSPDPEGSQPEGPPHTPVTGSFGLWVGNPAPGSPGFSGRLELFPRHGFSSLAPVLP